MPIDLAFRDGCAVLTLNRPEALNALSFAILGEIGAAIDEAAKSSGRALIVTGAGPKAFCAGADIKELGSRDLMAQKRGAELGQAVFARMGCPEIKLGLIPGYGGTQRLPRIIGEPRALELVMTGRTVDAVEAERIGLVSKIVSGDPVVEGLAFAKTFTGYSLPTLEFARAAVRRAQTVPLQEGFKIEADLSTLAYRTADAAEGIAAFAEKRPPRFRDA